MFTYLSEVNVTWENKFSLVKWQPWKERIWSNPHFSFLVWSNSSYSWIRLQNRRWNLHTAILLQMYTFAKSTFSETFKKLTINGLVLWKKNNWKLLHNSECKLIVRIIWNKTTDKKLVNTGKTTLEPIQSETFDIYISITNVWNCEIIITSCSFKTKLNNTCLSK
jgi:hypothetical protein